ncbi:PqqD family protein [Sporomusa sp.]|uniref:PqqD family protein n=1 Tax=Sporomusa sp. TaxID=2078658 RepID=UPI002BDCC295|nr:PqqD family protein [Sporomusa sp.]HWR05455.1 PqqD family protein [Sporomusa sp.]
MIASAILLKRLVPVRMHLKARVDNDFLIVSTKNLNIYYLNETARDFYDLVDGAITINEIVNKLMQVYEIDYATLEKDIVHLVRDLQWKELIVLTEGEVM